MPHTVSYVAVVERIVGKEFRAHFPDFPELRVRDATIKGVSIRGGQVLRAHINQLLQRNGDVPRPMSVDDVKAGGRYRHGFLLQIEADVPASRLCTRRGRTAARPTEIAREPDGPTPESPEGNRSDR